MTEHRTKILLIGEHDKGLGEPFSTGTVSGRSLRAILDELCPREHDVSELSSPVTA